MATDFNLDDDFEFDLDDFDVSDLDIDLDLDFSESDNGDKFKNENRYTLPKPFRQRIKANQVKFDRAEDFAKQLGQKILDGERINAVLSGNFIFGDFFEAFCYETNSLIDELQISTLSLSQDNVDSFHNLISGDYLHSLEIIVSDYWWTHNRANAPYIYKQLDIGNKFQFAVSGTHTKVALMRIGDKKIVISGSANLRSSRCVEEIQIETNPDLYDFHYEWQSTILKNYGMIKKAVRASALFDVITKGMSSEQQAKQQKAFKG